MATTKKETQIKLTASQAREKVEELQSKLDKFGDGATCYLCGKHKNKSNFHVCTDPRCKSGVARICKDCFMAIALRRDENGEDHEPTKESLMEALEYIDKPFLNSVWNASIQESQNLVTGKVRSTPVHAYVKNIAMGQYVGLRWKDSDIFKNKIKYDDEKTEKEIVEDHAGQDTYDSFIKNKEDVIRLLDYDPFEKESISDQPFLYSQLLGLLDSSEDANDDMMRTSSAISIVRGFLQSTKIDDTIAKLMSDINDLERNSATIKSLQDSKSKLTSMIKVLAEESCISLAHSKHSLKGENTWTGKIKKLKDLNLRDSQVNGFDIGTCRGMQQVLDLSNAAIMKQLHLDESEWSDMVAELREERRKLQKQLDIYIEVNRILLQENLDLKDYMEEKGIDIDISIRNLKDLYSPFASIEEENEMEVSTDESDNTSK